MSILESPWQLTDGVITIQFSFDQRDVTGQERPMVFLRLEDDVTGYAFRFEGDRKWMGIGFINGGIWESIRGDATDAIDFDEPGTIRIELEGNIFFIYYNDVLRSRIGDVKSKHAVGKIGLGASSVDTPIFFEQIRIEGEGVTQFIQDLRPVQPQDRLTLVWGDLKRQ